MDTTLKELLEEAVENTEPITGKLIKTLKNPRYSSGRLIKDNDRVIMVLEYSYKENDFTIIKYPDNLKKIKESKRQKAPTGMIRTTQTENFENPLHEKEKEIKELNFKMILIHEEEIKEFCKNYIYIEGDFKAIKVAKKPKNWK